MSDAAASDARHEVVCPHCRKPFSAELIAGDTARHQGFKCPHCRLFVPLDRVDDQEPAELSS
jgi:DNA-directed RNA polymerase subunit RPC12/RpoP